MNPPVIELDECILCEVCVDVCPEVFHLNDLGFIEVQEMDCYPVDAVQDAVKHCPSDCIVFTPE